ncbi:MAG TPA: fructose-bisphosphate aldolase class I [Dehalococcoidia bacterium]|nr:fructose-bisphosphate aldolase class I [Dehalococcoidia bacterium]
MNEHTLETTAQAMVAPGKGLFAADVPPRGLAGGWWGTMEEPKTTEAARDFQEMLFRTRGLSDYISGIIVFDDIFEQKSKDGTLFPELINRQGIMIGVTPTTGWQRLGGSPEERIPMGLDGLPERLERWRELGVRFVKWRVGVKVGPGLPTSRAIESNARSVAECAALAQNAGLVPIVEPEVEMRGEHDIQRHFEVSEWFLHRVFETLYEHRVLLDGIVLKTNMVLSGSDCPTQANVDTVVSETLKCIRRTVPAEVPGIGFLSGGQTDEMSTAHLNAMNVLGSQPWALSFSYGRAIGRAAMVAWDGKTDDSTGQTALLHRARMNGLATLGKWSADLETK